MELWLMQAFQTALHLKLGGAELVKAGPLKFKDTVNWNYSLNAATDVMQRGNLPFQLRGRRSITFPPSERGKYKSHLVDSPCQI